MRAQPIVEAVESLPVLPKRRTLLMAAGGQPFTQKLARDLATLDQIVLICGRYEGVDERVIDILRATPVSVGDYVLTGGELPAMIVIDAVSRLLNGVIDQKSIEQESFDSGLLEYPQYTRPAVYRGLAIPQVLLSGHHARIAGWRREQSLRRTLAVRPGLIERAIRDGHLTAEEIVTVRELARGPATRPAEDAEG